MIHKQREIVGAGKLAGQDQPENLPFEGPNLRGCMVDFYVELPDDLRVGIL
ncbi:hypothetical protein D3C81_2121550 [compost metagenome]